MARDLNRVIGSFKIKHAKSIVNTELAENTMAIIAGEGENFTAYCNKSILIQTHNIPKNKNLTNS